ncbi:MAG: hypothetical protein KKH98_15705 [Spirochaetes bacterium]|nr:hypothetical protein [Spirochaetota bacterium]
MAQKFQVDEKVYCVAVTSLPSAADLFGRWVVLSGKVITAVQSHKRGMIYEIELVAGQEKKYFDKREVIIPEDRVFMTMNEVKRALKIELKRVYHVEEEAIDNLFR